MGTSYATPRCSQWPGSYLSGQGREKGIVRSLSVVLFVAAFLVACSGPSAAPSRPQSKPPTVNLTGRWVVAMELEGFVSQPFTWYIVQSSSEVHVFDPNSPNIPCGEGTSKIEENRWTVDQSFNPSNCLVLAPLSGSMEFTALASGTAFAGPLTFTVDGSGTFRGRIAGVRQ